MMSALTAVHSQSQAPQFTNASAAITSSPLLIRPEGCTCGMPQYSVNEEFHPVISEIPAPAVPHVVSVPQPGPAIPQATVTYSASLVNIVPQEPEHIFHADSMGYDKVDDL
ncbi:hypothetical protein A2U01_0060565 [Trifolium medium]|uniref:Uncharacterized protein n=1 Tax=Trifolium medium TaxID=97028 RepID=A0A392RTE2_9FABA|nr:hypothetical protein [Trifolium medium]